MGCKLLGEEGARGLVEEVAEDAGYDGGGDGAGGDGFPAKGGAVSPAENLCAGAEYVERACVCSSIAGTSDVLRVIGVGGSDVGLVCLGVALFVGQVGGLGRCG